MGSSPPSVSAGFVFQLTRVSRRGHGPLLSFSSCGPLVSTDPNWSSTASLPRHYHLLMGGLVSVALPGLSPCTSRCRTSSAREGTSSGVPRDPLSHSVSAASSSNVLPLFNEFRDDLSRMITKENFPYDEEHVYTSLRLGLQNVSGRVPSALSEWVSGWRGACINDRSTLSHTATSSCRGTPLCIGRCFRPGGA